MNKTFATAAAAIMLLASSVAHADTIGDQSLFGLVGSNGQQSATAGNPAPTGMRGYAQDRNSPWNGDNNRTQSVGLNHDPANSDFRYAR